MRYAIPVWLLTLILIPAGWTFGIADATAQEVLSRTRHDLVHQGLTVLEVRTLDREQGIIHRTARTTDGTEVDVDALLRRESELETAFYRKLSPDLYDRVLRANPANMPLETALWMIVPGVPDFRLVLEEALSGGSTQEDARRVARDTAEQFFLPHTRALALGLAARGCEVSYTGTCWPVVIAWIPANEIMAVAADARVNRAYHCAPRWYTNNHHAQPTLRSPTVHARGITGKGSTLKVMVNDPDHVATGSPYLPTVTRLNAGNADLHATAVAGNICSKHSQYFGVARELPQIYSVTGAGDAGAPPAWDLGIKAGVSYGNCSWWNLKRGKIDFLDRWFDYTIRNFGVMMFNSAGNEGTSPAPSITTPGNAYNVTTTGCYNDGDSVDWEDDKMADYSSYKNPSEGHDKPEVVAPGDEVVSLSEKSPWIFSGFNGTSSASPMTCGVAALLGTRDSSLRTHTYTLKAILMASAWHNVEGNPVLSDKDGVGGVLASAADAVVRDKQFVDGTLTASSFPGGYKDIPIKLQAGTRTRIVALWFSRANSSHSTDVLEMDLDLVIQDPAKKVVASSAHTKNPFEIVAFYPTVTGTYTVRLQRQRFQGTSEPFAVAWSNRQDMATTEVTLSGTGRIGTTMNITFKDPYFRWMVYVAGASFSTLPHYLALPEGHLIPLGLDQLLLVTLMGAYPGFKGTLDHTGQAKASMAIPNLTVLRGMEIYLAVGLFRSGTSGSIVKSTSPAVKFKIQ